ncbi:translation initiation factor eIF2B subunit gamma [Prorops nasuta]|uniref:translation initiation factor eIF2B subunit gamma n=1 Tax=Prorops nasuta TaxID=863751 RepID=UPI0034CE34CF
MVYKELQAVVLAGGKGSRMTELTARQIKCLLPIGNMPLIWYPLQLLQNTGFKKVIIVVSENVKGDISQALEKLNLNIKLDIVGIPDAEDIGTADSIRHIHDKIQKDFIVVSCDLITNIDMKAFLNVYRNHNASITALLLATPKVPEDIITPGPKIKQSTETDLIGIDNETDRLVFLASASDFEETIKISRNLMRKHVAFTIHSKLMDAHLYIIRKWVLDFLVYNKSFSTLKGELLPYIVKKQFSKSLQQMIDDKNTSLMNIDIKNDVYRFATEEPLDELARKLSGYIDHNTDMENVYCNDIIRCYAHVVKGKFGLRVNTIQMYNLANIKVSNWFGNIASENKIPEISPKATIKCTQMEACRVAANTFIDAKTSIKESHIGPNTTIEQKTRISQSIIMENVTIKERCVIQNCILCNGCIIEEGTQLKDCLVGAQHVVKADSNHSREMLAEADQLIEI